MRNELLKWAVVPLLWLSDPAMAGPIGSGGSGKWLVDLGRDVGQWYAQRPRYCDALHILAMMRAAARIEPDLAEAYYWQFDLLGRLGRNEQALAALQRYIDLQRDDVTAQLQCLELQIGQAQTAEQRIELCRKLLQRTGLTDAVRSDLHRRLAELAYQRANDAVGDRHIEQSLRAFPMNLATRSLQYQMRSAGRSHAARVQMMLELIRAAPRRLEVVWELGRLLDRLSLHAQAQRWYEHALKLFERMHPDRPVPRLWRFELARSLADSGQLRRAAQLCQRIIHDKPDYIRARLLMYHIAGKLGRDDQAAQQLRAIDEHYRPRLARVRQEMDWSTAAEMAWFYSLYQPAGQLAMSLAQMAVRVSGGDPQAMRSLGFAALANDQPEAAVEALQPLAETDQMAAVGLARAWLAKGQTDRAIGVLQRAARLQYSGLAFEQIAELLSQHGRPVPQPPPRDAILKLLASFDWRVLDFCRRPGQFIRLRLSFDSQQLPLIGPWYCRFELSNIGPVPVTLGLDLMVAPTVLVSALADDQQQHSFDNYCLISLDRQPLLQPGQSIRLVQSIDLGRLRELMRSTPQRRYRLRFSAILDPVRTAQGQWSAAPGGVRSEPVEVVRARFVASPERVDQLIASAQSGPPEQRCRAVAILASLLAEAQRFEAGQLHYRPIPIDVAAVRAALLSAATSGHWLVRAHALEALRLCRLDDEMIRQAAEALSDRHWLVRMMAVRLFADHQGRAFAKVVDRLAASDPDELVRLLARSYRLRWREVSARPVRPRLHRADETARRGPTKAFDGSCRAQDGLGWPGPARPLKYWLAEQARRSPVRAGSEESPNWTGHGGR